MVKRVDYHIHTTFSDGEGSYKEVIDRARELNLESIAITDHFDPYDPNPSINNIREMDLIEHFSMIKEYACKKGQRVICGIETCTDFYGKIRLSDRVIKNCEIIITSPHYIEYGGSIIPGKYYDDKFWTAYKNKVINMAKGSGNILGHMESYLPYGSMLVPNTTTFEGRIRLAQKIANRYFDEKYIDELIDTLRVSNKAIELHCMTKSPRDWVIDKLSQNNIPMSIGSDAHALDAVGMIDWGIEKIKEYECIQYSI